MPDYAFATDIIGVITAERWQLLWKRIAVFGIDRAACLAIDLIAQLRYQV